MGAIKSDFFKKPLVNSKVVPMVWIPRNLGLLKVFFSGEANGWGSAIFVGLTKFVRKNGKWWVSCK